MKKLSIIILLSFSVFGCKKELKKDSEKLITVKIVQEWFANANYAGEVVAQHKYDSINKINIEIIEGSYEIDPIKMVLSGEAQIGVAGADKILVANDKGADLVVFGVVNPISPVCFVSLKENNIITAKDFKGKNIGVLTGTATEYVYRSLLKKEGLDPSELKESEISFDLNTFINKIYDVRPAFIFDEPVSLDKQKIEYNVLEPSKYGIKFLGTVYFCKRSYLNGNKQVLQDLTNSLIQGWDFALKNNNEAIEYLKLSFPSIDKERELSSLKKGINYFKGDENKQLFANMKKWEEMALSLEDLKVINKFDSKNIDYSFINNYYNVKGN